jgi:hypothetical protein
MNTEPDKPQVVDTLPKIEELKAPYISIVNAVTGELVGVQEWQAPLHITSFKAAFIAAIEQHNVAYGSSVQSFAATSAEVANKLGNKKMAMPMEAARGMVMQCQTRIEEALVRISAFQGGYGEQVAVVLPFAYIAQQGEGAEATVDIRKSKPFVNGLIFTGVFRDEIGAHVAKAA